MRLRVWYNQVCAAKSLNLLPHYLLPWVVTASALAPSVTCAWPPRAELLTGSHGRGECEPRFDAAAAWRGGLSRGRGLVRAAELKLTHPFPSFKSLVAQGCKS